MNAVNRVVVNTGVLYARMAITVFLSLYTTRVTLAALGFEDFGIFNVVGGAIAMLTFLNTSMAAATQRFMSFAQGQGNYGRQRSIFNVSLLLHAIITLAVLLILEGAGFALFHGILQIAPKRIDAAKLVYQFAVVSTLFTIVSVPYDAVINARENMLLFAVLGVIEALLKLTVALFVADAATDKLTIYGFLMANLSIVLLILRVVYCHVRYHECTFAPRRYFDKPLLREMSAFAGWSFLGASTSMLANYGQGIVLNMFFGTVVNAAQGIANQISGQLSAFAGTMLRALNPLIAKSEGAGNRELMLRASMIGSKVSFFLLMFFYVPVMLEMPYIFSLWLKEVPGYAILFCQLQLIRNLVEQLFLTLAASIYAVGNIKNFQVVTSFLSIFPLAMSYFLFKINFPPTAMYASFIVYAAFTSIVTLYFAKIFCGFSYWTYIRDIVFRCGSAFLLSLFVSALPLWLVQESVLRLFFVVVVSIVSSIIMFWYIGFNTAERKSVGVLLKEIIMRIRAIAA